MEWMESIRLMKRSRLAVIKFCGQTMGKKSRI